MTNTTTFNTTTNATNTIPFRKKLITLIEQVDETNRETMVKAIEKVLEMKHGAAKRWFFKAYYNVAEAMAELGLSSEMISEEDFLKLRNQLYHQYDDCRKLNFEQSRQAWQSKKKRGEEKPYIPFLRVDQSEFSEARKSAYAELVKETDENLAFFVYGHCAEMSQTNPEAYEKTLRCLASKRAESVFGGFRNLISSGTSGRDEIIRYLQPNAVQVHNLYKIMCQEYTAYCEAERAAETKRNKPMNTTLAGLGAAIKEKGIILPDEAPAEMAEVVAPCSVELTSKLILEHGELFTRFVESEDMNVLLEIGKLGVDLNEVITKKALIKSLFAARNNVLTARLVVVKAELQLKNMEEVMSQAADALDAK